MDVENIDLLQDTGRRYSACEQEGSRVNRFMFSR